MYVSNKKATLFSFAQKLKYMRFKIRKKLLVASKDSHATHYIFLNHFLQFFLMQIYVCCFLNFLMQIFLAGVIIF